MHMGEIMRTSLDAAKRFVLMPFVMALVLALSVVSFETSAYAEEGANVRVSKIKVRFAKDAKINWWHAENKYMRKYHPSSDWSRLKRRGEDEQDVWYRLSKSPKARAYIKRKLKRLILQKVKAGVNSRVSGRKRVVLDITVREFFVPDPARRLVIGGFPELHFTTVAKYARNGRVIGTFDEKVLALALGGVSGVVVDQLFPDLEDRIIDNYNIDIAEMLAEKT